MTSKNDIFKKTINAINCSIKPEDVSALTEVIDCRITDSAQLGKFHTTYIINNRQEVVILSGFIVPKLLELGFDIEFKPKASQMVGDNCGILKISWDSSNNPYRFDMFEY